MSRDYLELLYHNELIKTMLLLFNCQVVSNSFATLWTAASQAPLSMGLPSQEYWSGLPFPSPGNLPSIGTEPTFPELRMGGSVVEFSPATREAQVHFLAHAAMASPFQASLWLSWRRICLQCGRPGFDPWGGKISLEKRKATHSSILAGKSHG